MRNIDDDIDIQDPEYKMLMSELNDYLSYVMRRWTTDDYFKSRKDRNWDVFDKMSVYQKLKHREKEAHDYLLKHSDKAPVGFYQIIHEDEKNIQ